MGEQDLKWDLYLTYFFYCMSLESLIYDEPDSSEIEVKLDGTIILKEMG